MSIKNSPVTRTATIAASFLLTLLIAAFATGCAAEGSSGAQSATPGSYAIDPAAVDSSTITEPVSCMVVTSASQNSAFRISSTCLAYPKAAIEQGNYAGYITCDAGSTPHGKTFATTKNSQAGQEKEIDSFLADYFTSVCGARAQTGEIDTLSALNNAANELRAHDNGSKMVISVVGSGLNPTGLLAGGDFLNADANDIANQLAGMGALANFSGIEVHFYGLGQASGEQVIPSSIAAKLQTLYPTLVEATGGVAIVEPDVLTRLGCDADLPSVSTIDFEQDSLSFPHLEHGQSAQVVLNETVLAFVGDSAEFIDPAQAKATLSELADTIASNSGATVLVEGYTAASPAFSRSDLVDLSQRRAEAVRDALIAAGVNPGSIEAIGRGDEGATSMDTGTFDETAAKNDRCVVVTLSLA